MASFPHFFNNFLLLLIHLGCFVFISNPQHHSNKRKITLRSHKTTKAFSSSWSFLKQILTHKTATKTHPNPDITITIPPSLSLVSVSSLVPLESNPPRETLSQSRPEYYISSHQQFYPLRNDIYPCPTCGEVFLNPNPLEQHKTVNHAVSELSDCDSGKNIVQIIFNTGWPCKMKNPNVARVLRIHNSAKILARFEEYREKVKLRATRNTARRHDERCMVDGNELLRFHCATFLCCLGQNGNSSICNHPYCSVCGIIKSGFSPKLDGISTLSTSWRAHLAIPKEIEEEFRFMHVKRAMFVCRVIAGRVGCESSFEDKEDSGFDSVVVGKEIGPPIRLDDHDELLVFNPRAVLACFVIVYTV